MSFINTTKYADDATLVSLYADSWRRDYTITHETKDQMAGSVSFNRIQPGNKDNGIKNIYLEMYAEFTVTKAAAATIRLQNVNDAIYDCTVTFNGSAGYMNQPYINSIIKRCFDEDAFIEQASVRHDKYVNAEITPNAAGTSVSIKYYCMTPIYHEFFDAKEITGINDLSVRFNYNLYNIFKATMINPQAAGAGTAISAVALTNDTLKWQIIYDEVKHEIPSDLYTMQVPHYIYFESKNDFTIDASSNSNNEVYIDLHDAESCPLRCYLISSPRIKNETTALCNVIPSRFISSRWNIDNKNNAFMSDGTDKIMYNFVNSKSAGLKSEFMTWAGRCDNITGAGVPIDPIIGITTLGTTNTYTNTNDLCRIHVKGTINHDQLSNCTTDRTLTGMLVYEYPAVLSTGTINNIIYTLDMPKTQLTEIEMDDNDYIKSLEQAGLLVGGSKVGDWFKNLWHKIKSGKFISKTLNWIGNDSKKFNNLLSMVPVVGQFVPQIQEMAKKGAVMAEDAGLGVNLF